MTSSRAPLLQPFYPALDGLRALAFLVVFTWHYCRGLAMTSEVWAWGWVGVDQFFVLSGFLITGILFDTVHKANYFRSFYIRRALRIFPLFYAFWLLCLVLTPVLHIQWNRYVGAMAFYLGNLFIPGANMGLHATPSSIPYLSLRHSGTMHGIRIEHFWSLCVEEQFYLAWPAVVWLVRSRRALFRLCLAGVVASPILRMAILHFAPQQLNSMGLYFPTYVRCDSLLIGSALALWFRSAAPKTAQKNLKAAAFTVLILSVGLLICGLVLEPQHYSLRIADPFVCTIGYSLIALASGAILVLALFPGTVFARFLQLRPLVAMGRISYGLYVIHDILQVPLEGIIPHLTRYHLVVLYPVIGLGLSWVLATLSFRFLESPFLRLKHVLAPQPGAIDDPPALGESIRE